MPKPVNKILADNVYGYPAGQTIGISLKGGSFTSIEPLAGEAVQQYMNQAPIEESLDLRGLFVLPGLIDAHVHAIASGMLLLGNDLHEVRLLDEIVAAFKVQVVRADEYVRLAGLDLSRLLPAEHKRLDRAWLDQLSPAKPLIIKSVEGHSSWFNSRAWELLRINSVLEHCAVSTLEAQEMWESGRVFGEAYENLSNSIYDTYSHGERREGLRRFLDLAASVGLTGMHCLEGYGAFRREDFELISELDGQTCHLTLYARDKSPGLAKEMGLERFGGCWCVDGAIGARTAAISSPYADQPACIGDLYYSDDELSGWITSGLAAEMQVCVHAIGDRALEQTITIYENLASQYDLKKLRPRVDHFILGTPDLARRAAAMGMCSAMQPAFDARWGGAHGGYATRLGAERALLTNPVGGMIEAGLIVAGSSDSYITPIDPLGGIRAAMNHHNEQQRVSVDSAIKLFSEHAAYLAGEEAFRGRIVPGYSGDLTVLSADPRSETAVPVTTIVAGNVVYVRRT